ncbi:ankyrin repeat domain-containing protein 27 [Podospora aff. communis PSN243]|uniref:Ankyrin repeat domain-containing protein 27 n=1 Tax=Podospora aff. communis PSN243 TaxID=3040156 RepID=A0AAV9H6M6_9PEZI|nr:ankyrin repeat domain-containing protein 27 [Podospora aff. communis PSN243]
MHFTHQESHMISVLAGQGEIIKLKKAVHELAERENTTPAEVLITCKDDYQQTSAHMAAKSGQSRSIEALAELVGDDEKKSFFFNMANRFTGDRPVHTAMRHGYFDVFKALVRHGADPTVKNRFGDAVTDYQGDYEAEEIQTIVDEYNKRVSKGVE